MGRPEVNGVFDRAPVLFRPSRDLLHPGDQTVDVFAIPTIKLFHAVEKLQRAPVHHDVFAARLHVHASSIRTGMMHDQMTGAVIMLSTLGDIFVEAHFVFADFVAEPLLLLG